MIDKFLLPAAKDGVDGGALGDGFARLRRLLAGLFLGLEVVDVKAQDIPVLDGVGDGVGVELLLEEVRRGSFWMVVTMTLSV